MGSEAKYKTKTVKNLLIPMRDGIHLAGDLHAPEGDGPFPGLLSFYPYHKDDLIFYGYMEDSIRYFVERGYAHMLVDFRGLGNSQGFNREPFDPQENEDGHDVVEWMAAQSWCDGNVGMWGLSYGALTSLKTAATSPLHLKCIVPLQGCIDIYHTFVYPGGALNLFGCGAWASMMLAMNLMPPTYQDEDGRWARVWKEHLEQNEPWLLAFLDHPAYDEYWQRRRIRFEEIRVPTFVIAGWRDVVVGDTPEFYAGIPAPKKLLMGPWMHGNPHQSSLAPVDHLHEMCRWFDHWLRGENTGIVQEPPVTLYVQGEGRWRFEREWPLDRTQPRTWHLTADRLLSESPAGAGAEEFDEVAYDATVGVQSTLWDPLGLGIGLPQEQGPDDLRSLTYTSPLLAEDLEVTGEPTAILHVASSVEDVNVAVKLCDVAPDGSSHLVTVGWLKATHHLSPTHPELLQPGQLYRLDIRLWPTSYRFRTGHRIRVSIALSDFPRLWPTPKEASVRVFRSEAHRSLILLPTVPAQQPELPAPGLVVPPPGLHPPSILSYRPEWNISRDLADGTVTVRTGEDSSFRVDPTTTFSVNLHYEATVGAKDPAKVVLRSEATMAANRPVNGSRVEAWALVTTRQASLGVDIYLDEKPFFSRRWDRVLRTP